LHAGHLAGLVKMNIYVVLKSNATRISSCIRPSFQHDRGSRFEMILVVPTSHPADILKLDDVLIRGSDGETAGRENVLDQINREMAGVGGGGILDITLTMPQFSVKGDIDVNGILKEVRRRFNVGLRR
jgi:hypothetical protein